MEIVDLAKAEQLQEKFTAICGLQTVPVIDDNQFILGESSAILRYLAKKYSVPDHWYPTEDSQKQARLEEYLHWHGSNTRPNAMWTFRHQFVPAIKGEPVNEEEVSKYKTGLAKTLDRIENYFMKDSPFIAGSEISVADLQALCELMQLDIVGNEHLYLARPKVKDWVDRVKEVVGTHLDDCLSQGVMETKERYNKVKSEAK